MSTDGGSTLGCLPPLCNLVSLEATSIGDVQDMVFLEANGGVRDLFCGECLIVMRIRQVPTVRWDQPTSRASLEKSFFRSSVIKS